MDCCQCQGIEEEFDDGCGNNCYPAMELEGINTVGLLTFSFDRDMVIPENYTDWEGNNTYLHQ